MQKQIHIFLCNPLTITYRSNISDMSLKNKLLITLFSIAVIPMFVVGGWVYFSAQQAIETSKIAGLESTADLKAQKIEEFFTERRKDIILVQNNLIIRENLSSLVEKSVNTNDDIYQKANHEIDNVLKIKNKIFQYKINILITDLLGKIIYSLDDTADLNLMENIIKANYDEFRKPHTAEIYFSDIYTPDHRPIFMLMMVPAYDINDQQGGIIVFKFEMDALFNFIQDTKGLGKTGETIVIKNRKNNPLILSRLRHDLTGKQQHQGILPLQSALHGNHETGLTTDYRGRKVLAVQRNIPQLDWELIVKIDEQEAFQSVFRLKRIVLSAGLVSIVTGIIIALFFSRSLTKPIEALKKGVVQIGSGGELDIDVDIHRKDEIGILAREFTKMAENLKIITASRDELDREVSVRIKAEQARKRSEKQFQDLVENSPTGISIVQDDRIVYQNPEQEKLLGPLPRTNLFSDFEKIHPDDLDMVKQFHERLLSKEVNNATIEYRFFPDQSGNDFSKEKWVHVNAGWIEFQGKESFLINILDVSKTKELEKIIRTQDKMSSLGRVAAGIAHEIRNPLSGINIYLDTLRKTIGKPDSYEKQEKIIDRSKDASKKIETIIKRVMDFSKPGEPMFVLSDINRPIEEAIQLSSVTLRKTNIKLVQTLGDNLPDCRIDTHMIEQVILNIITNAIEAMKDMEDNKRIEISSFSRDNAICVMISDSGHGVPERMRGQIFEPFYSTKRSGSGIGLSICHRIIVDHGGTLSVSTNEMGGAEFIIQIPIPV